MIDFNKLNSVKINSNEVEQKIEKQDKKRQRPFAKDNVVEQWRVKINDNALVYIPNITVNGEKGFFKESAYIYPIWTKQQGFMQIRDTTNINLPDQGISGTEPLHTIEQENWEIYNAKVKRLAEANGVDPKDESIKSERLAFLDDFSIRPSDQYTYFPIVYIDTKKTARGKSSTKLADATKNADNKMIIRPFIFKIKTERFDKIFGDVLDMMEDDNPTLAGHFYNFSYVTGKKTSELSNPKRDSGKEFRVSLTPNKAKTDFTDKLDELVASMTPEFLRENVFELMILPDAVHEEIAQDAHAKIERELEIIRQQELAEGEAESQKQLDPFPDSADDTVDSDGLPFS